MGSFVSSSFLTGMKPTTFFVRMKCSCHLSDRLKLNSFFAKKGSSHGFFFLEGGGVFGKVSWLWLDSKKQSVVDDSVISL